MRIPERETYSPPLAELLYLYFQQPVLEGSSTLDDGGDDNEWGNDNY